MNPMWIQLDFLRAWWVWNSLIGSSAPSLFSQYLSLQSVQHLDTNRGDSNPDTKIIQQFIQQRLNIRPELKQRVIDKYVRDYALINEIFKE